MSPSAIRRLLRLYPNRWRERYEAEFAALLESHPATPSTIVDVVAGAIVAHTRSILEAIRPGGIAWDVLRHELRYVARGLARQPVFTAGVVATLALGIGANAAMFGIIDRLLFRPPAFLRDAERVHRVYFARTVNGKEFPGPNTQYRRYLEITRWSTSLDRAAAVFHPTVAVGVGDDARETHVAAVSATLFDFFDAPPVIGRYFTEQEDATPSGAPVAVLTYAYWQTKYGRRPSVLGEKIHIGPLVYTIIGVAPKGFVGLSRLPSIAFIPITSFGGEMMNGRNDPSYYTEYSSSWMEMIVRRKPGMSVEAATRDLSAAYRRSYAEQRAISPRIPPIDVAKPRAIVGPLLKERGPQQSKDAKVATWLAGVAVIVLLVACANVANLLLARSVARRREIAVRLALGVSRFRLIVQLGCESGLVAVLGGLTGLAIAQWGGGALESFLLPGVVGQSFAWDRRALVFSAMSVMLVATLLAVVPIMHAMRTRNLVTGLKAGVREGTRQRSRTRATLLVLQVALSLVLLVASGLFVRSLVNVASLNLGYDVAPILYVETELRNETLAPTELAALKRRLLERAQNLPGVASAARVTTVPFYGSSSGPIFVPGLDTSVINKHGEFTRQTASPEYFTTAGTRIIRGRAFTAADTRTTPRVALVTDAMAKVLWPNEDPIGKCFKSGSDTMPCTTVIGVTENVRLETLGSDSSLHYYLPIEQRSPAGGGLFVRMKGDGRGHAESVRRELQRLMPGASYVTVTPFADIFDTVARSWRLGAAMFTAFGALAALLAAIGLYGVIAHDVTLRTHELGVRVALGAQTMDVIRLVVGEGVRLGATGIGAGIVIAFAAVDWIAPLLFEESPRDPLVFVFVTAMLLMVAAAASYVPARRATRVDPNTALRAD